MQRFYSKVSAVAIIAAALAFVGTQHAQTPAPELIVYNGKIVTVDGAFSVAQATSIRAGKFVMVGTDKTVLATAGPSTTKIDLQQSIGVDDGQS